MNGSSTIRDITPRRALEILEKSLRFSEEELAQALNSNCRTLQRWRAGTAHPQWLARRRPGQLLDLQQRSGNISRAPMPLAVGSAARTDILAA